MERAPLGEPVMVRLGGSDRIMYLLYGVTPLSSKNIGKKTASEIDMLAKL